MKRKTLVCNRCFAHSSLIWKCPTGGQPWLRMLDPSLPPNRTEPIDAGLQPYQRFFFHAATCQAQLLDDGQSSAVFLTQNMYPPMFGKVWGQDRVCSTHQLMGLELHRQMRCTPGSPAQAQLVADLASDVRTQLHISRCLKMYCKARFGHGGWRHNLPIWNPFGFAQVYPRPRI